MMDAAPGPATRLTVVLGIAGHGARNSDEEAHSVAGGRRQEPGRAGSKGATTGATGPVEVAQELVRGVAAHHADAEHSATPGGTLCLPTSAKARGDSNDFI